MSIQKEYEAYLNRRAAIARHHFGKIWLEQTSRYVHPFQLYGNVWYGKFFWLCGTAHGMGA